MQKPANMTAEECCDLHVQRTDDNRVISAWRPTPEELVKINMGENIYLHICGPTMPPVALTVGEE